MFRISPISRVSNHKLFSQKNKANIKHIKCLIDIKGDFAWKKLSSSLDAGAKVYG